MEGDGVVLSLEEQLNALSLSTGPSSGPGPLDTVSLNGNHFASGLFEDITQSTKVCSVHLSVNSEFAVNSETSHQRGNMRKGIFSLLFILLPLFKKATITSFLQKQWSLFKM